MISNLIEYNGECEWQRKENNQIGWREIFFSLDPSESAIHMIHMHKVWDERRSGRRRKCECVSVCVCVFTRLQLYALLFAQ